MKRRSEMKLAACLTAVVLGEEGQQLEAELELERVLESCRKQKGVG